MKLRENEIRNAVLVVHTHPKFGGYFDFSQLTFELRDMSEAARKEYAIILLRNAASIYNFPQIEDCVQQLHKLPECKNDEQTTKIS